MIWGIHSVNSPPQISTLSKPGVESINVFASAIGGVLVKPLDFDSMASSASSPESLAPIKIFSSDMEGIIQVGGKLGEQTIFHAS